MLETSTLLISEPAAKSGVDVVEAVRAVASRELPSLVHTIDADGYYPESVMREFGRLGRLVRLCGRRFYHCCPGGGRGGRVVSRGGHVGSPP